MIYAYHPDMVPGDCLHGDADRCCEDSGCGRRAVGVVELRSGVRLNVCQDCYQTYWADNAPAGFWEKADAGQMRSVRDPVDDENSNPFL